MIWTVCILLSLMSFSHSEDCPAKHMYALYGPEAIVEYLTVEATNYSNPVVMRKVVMPSNLTLFLGMLVAETEDGPEEFRFETTYNEQYGHFVTSINGVENNQNNNNRYWIVYDAKTNISLPCGVDSTYPENDAHFIWRYEKYTSYD